MKKLTILCIAIGLAVHVMASEYTLAIYADGCASPNRYICDNGQQVSITVVPDPGFRFAQWSDGNTANPRTFTVTADAAYTARFEPIGEYTLSIYADGCSTPNRYICDDGQQVSITVVPEPGSRFAQWSDGNTSNPRTFTVTADATYTAQFESASEPTSGYTLAVYADGCASPNRYICDNGQQVSITVVPEPGSRFAQWSDGNTSNPRTFTVTADATYTAQFESASEPTSGYTLAVYADGCDTPNRYICDGGQQVSITVVPEPGSRFAQWSDGNTANPRTFTVTQDMTFTAVFEQIEEPQNDKTIIRNGEMPDIIDITGEEPEVVIESGGALEANSPDIRQGVITIVAAGGQSGQIHHAENLSNWRFFMEHKLNPFGSNASPDLWYAFAVPFEVDIENGITRAYGKKSHVPGVDFLILEYDGMLHAQTGKGWVKKNTGSLVPGTFYMIGIEGDCNRWCFEKKSGAAVQGDDHVDLIRYSSGNFTNDKHNGWNGKGNSRLEYSQMNLSDIADYIYSYDNEFGKFELKTAAGMKLCVGQPFFIQAKADASFDFVHSSSTHNMPALYADRQTQNPLMHFTLTSDQMHVGTDYMYVTMHEDAVTTYTIGRDVARMSMNCQTAAQLWCLSADGTELAAHDIALPETETVIPLRLFAPNDGEYLLNMSERATDDFEVELLYNGTYAATLFADQPLALTLNAGTITGYSIRVRRRMQTGIDEISSSLQGGDRGRLIYHEGQIYILRGEKVYTLQGQEIK